MKPFGFWKTASGGGSYDSRAVALFAAIEGEGGTLSLTEKNVSNQWFLDADSYGIYNDIIAAWLYIGGTAASHKWNFINPVNSDAAGRLTYPAGGITHGNGVFPNGTSGYARTFLTPGTSGLTQNSVGISYYSLTSGAGGRDMGTSTGFRMIIQYGNGFSYYDLNDTTSNNITGITTTGLITATRVNSTDIYLYSNGVQVTGTVSNSVPDYLGDEIYLFRADGEYGMRGSGGNLIHKGLNATKAANLNTIMTTFNTGLSR